MAGNISIVLKIIQKQVKPFVTPSVTLFSRKSNHYLVLVSCILSLRTKDKTTIEASKRLFNLADNPKKMVKLSQAKLEKIIYPVGFYRNKARVLKEISLRIMRDFTGRVPNNLDDLLSFKGVGRKTANLVLGLGFGIPAICVDTHVHRISNRLGWVRSKNPFDTELALEKIIPRRCWIESNTILVGFGQNICLPISPLCSNCHVRRLCKRVGVKICR
ncbi:MAG: endonuclease III [Candidatus Omnitrophota bacterium]|nr:endonuclease III [Candidatus Omnitrophota bacterium]